MLVDEQPAFRVLPFVQAAHEPEVLHPFFDELLLLPWIHPAPVKRHDLTERFADWTPDQQKWSIFSKDEVGIAAVRVLSEIPRLSI